MLNANRSLYGQIYWKTVFSFTWTFAPCLPHLGRFEAAAYHDAQLRVFDFRCDGYPLPYVIAVVSTEGYWSRSVMAKSMGIHDS